jgi:hypothetical protein
MSIPDDEDETEDAEVLIRIPFPQPDFAADRADCLLSSRKTISAL